MTVPNFTNDHFGYNSEANVKNINEVECEDGWTKVGEVPIRTFKVIILGDSGVGKTCLTLRVCADEFPISTYNTIGVDVKIKRIDVAGEYVDLQLWDTAGQERFRYGVVPHYYRNVHAVVFVYDVTSKSSFESLGKWVSEMQKNIGVVESIPQIIIGNKCDLNADRQVATSEATKLALSLGLPLWETSAKSDMEVDTLKTIFQSLGKTLKLDAPLVRFPPHFSYVIQADHNKGLKVHQSLSASFDQERNTKCRRNKMQKRNCCSV